MASEDQEEKTEEATQARREEFRKQGNVAQTRELASALFLLVAAGGVYSLGRYFFSQIYDVFHYAFGADMVETIRHGNFAEAGHFVTIKFFTLILPVFGVGLLIALASSVLQIGFLQVEDAMSPDIEKINPLSGFQRIVSLKSLVEAGKSLLKLVIIGSVLAVIMKQEVVRLPWLIQMSLEGMIEYMGMVTVKLLAGIGVLMVIISAADYFFIRFDLERKMRMTKQEIKEEHKQREGDPMIKSRIRRVQREMANKRMMEAVPKADVVITNPTHIAVVLKYDANTPAPQLVAKGADLVAEKIKEIARQNNIPVVENKPLARTIFKTMKIGQVIPRELYVAVAEVLSYVYKLKKRLLK